MNAETPNPRLGDRVRVTFEGTVAHLDDHDRVATVKTSDDRSARGQYVPLDATVEVLERADDPSKALRGEVRQIDDMTAVCYGKDMWVTFSALHHGATGGYGVFKDAQMVGAPVTGVVPGTPAAEAREQWRHCDTCECIHPPCGYVMGSQGCDSVCDQTPARRSVRVENTPGPPADVRAKIRRHIEDGDEETAVVVAQNAGIADARSYVEATWEYLNRHGEKLGTRVFLSDGPEPPADVELLRFFGTPARINGLFLRRSVDLQLRWVWLADPEADISGMVGDTNWPVPNVRGTFTEEVV